jgi:hypothetical protein
MQRRTLIAMLVLNVLVSAGVIFAVLALRGPQSEPTSAAQIITVEVRLTQPPQPTQTPWIITVTPQPGTPSTFDLPPGVLPDATQELFPTLDPTLFAGNPDLATSSAALPAGCIPHALESGQNPAILAEIYGVDVFDILAVNNLTEEDVFLLQIGQVLIIPLEGCPLTPEQVAVVTGGETGDATEEVTAAVVVAGADGTAEAAVPTVTPTITLAPTAVNAQVQLVQVVGRGDVTAEGIEIRNNGATVDMTGWTISDAQNNVYTFPTRRLFSQAQITLFTRVGPDTAAANFWGRDTAVWGDAGDVVTLANAQGEVQAVLRLP